MRLEREPIRNDDPTQEDGRSQDENTDDQEVARQIPSPPQQDLEATTAARMITPMNTPAKSIRPPEHRRQRVSNFHGSSRAARRHRREPQDDGRHCQEHRVERAPVSASRLVIC